MLPAACHKFIIHTSQLNQLTLEITGANSMRLEDSPFITGAPEFMRSKLGSHLSSLMHLPSPRNKIRIKSVVREPCIDQRIADVELEALHYKLRFDGLPVSRGAHWAPITATHMGASNLQSYFRKYYNRESNSSKLPIAHGYLLERSRSSSHLLRLFVLVRLL